ncbi:MAG: HU family DNA-binding protein [Erysipelotrichaceae bacterium]|nr:HU family DNA-binding protein [Erysipelotrichaceae bacterium]
MNRKELINAVADKKDITKKEAEEYVDVIFETMTEAFMEGENVLISGFGTFQFKDRPARNGVSPQTGEYMTIPASKTVSFKPSNKLKDAMNQ